MQKLLIAEGNEAFAYALEKTFESEFEIRVCRDGRTVAEEILRFRPDAMILNLTLPFKDGLTILQEAAELPPVILGTTNYVNDYIALRAMELGVGYLLLMPCLEAVRLRLTDLLERQIQQKGDPQLRIAAHLQLLKIPSHRDGYQYLCFGIPLFAQDPGQRLSKELYPAIADLCSCKDGRAVEHSIRIAIEAGWKVRDAAVWERYFPGVTACPSNKVFIAKMAELLRNGR